MTYEQIVSATKAKFEKANTKKIKETLAIQVNIEGKNVNGIFYIEVKDGKVNVEPYDYYDHNAIVYAAPSNIMKMLDGKLKPEAAFKQGKVKIDGDTAVAAKIFSLAKIK